MTEQLISKRNIFLTGLILVLVVGIFGFIGTLIILKIVKDLNNGIPFPTTMFIVPLLFYSFLLYTFYYLLTYFPSLTIDKNGIKISTVFKSRNYSWTEIKEIKLLGKRPHKFLFTSIPLEATTIRMTDNSEVFIWADYYRNKSDLRIILERANNILKRNKQFSILDFNIYRPNFKDQLIDDSYAKEFNGNHLFTFNGLFFYGWLIFIGFMILIRPQIFLTNYGAVISLSFATLAISGMLTYQMHNFRITNQFLIVRNTIWFWHKDIYSLSDIREIVIETPHKLSTSLRVITNDFRDKLYPAGSLHDKTWKELLIQLQKDNIKVRNESI